jgi:hypothetical protein
MATIRLKCALALHRFLNLQEARSEEFAPASSVIFEKTEPLMLVNAFAECQRRKVCVRVGVLHLFTNPIPARTDERLVSPQSFPHLWKKLWKFGCFGFRRHKTLMKTTVFRLPKIGRNV